MVADTMVFQVACHIKSTNLSNLFYSNHAYIIWFEPVIAAFFFMYIYIYGYLLISNVIEGIGKYRSATCPACSMDTWVISRRLWVSIGRRSATRRWRLFPTGRLKQSVLGLADWLTNGNFSQQLWQLGRTKRFPATYQCMRQPRTSFPTCRYDTNLLLGQWRASFTPECSKTVQNAIFS